MICDRAHEGERSAAFQAAVAALGTEQVAAHQAGAESDGKLCLAPGSLPCLGRAVDWRARFKTSVSQMMELANDTLASVAKMVRDHHAALDSARADGVREGDATIAELRALVDLANRTAEAAKAWMATCPDVEPDSPGYSEFVTLRQYLSDAGRSLVLSQKARTWHDGVRDAIKAVVDRRDALAKITSVMVTPIPAAVQMAEHIVRDLKALLAKGSHETSA